MEWSKSTISKAELEKKEGYADIIVSLKKELNAERVKNFAVKMASGLTYNYAAKQVNDQILGVMQNLADEMELTGKFAELFNGATINTGENRKVLHHLLRGQLGNDIEYNGKNARSFYVEQQEKIAAFAKDVHEGKVANAKGEKFTTVVQIGIGGSDLGPRAMYLALEEWAKKNNSLKLNAKFISNVDPDDGAAVISTVDLAHTLFVLVSKSGTTQETLANELFVKDFIKKGVAEAVVSDGFDKVGYCDQALIAGMGGEEITAILSKAESLPNRLILQPMKNCDKVRLCAVKRGYKVVNDGVFKSAGKFYDLIVLEKGADSLTREEIEFGRDNVKDRSQPFKEMLLEKMQKALPLFRGYRIRAGADRLDGSLCRRA